MTRDVAETTLFTSLAALPADAVALFRGDEDFYGSADWYQTVIDAALPHGSAACFAVTRLGGQAVALWPLLRMATGTMSSLTSPYTCLYQPLLAPGLDEAELVAVGRSFGRHQAMRGGVLLDALDAAAASWPGLCAGFRKAGLWVLQFEHFGNWHEDVSGQDWARYLAARPGALRETLRRRSARLLAQPTTSVTLLTRPDEIEPGIEAFEAIYRRSWKQPEPYPGFNAACIRMAARRGVARLAVLRRNDEPVAVQFWVVLNGTAQVLKLAHDEAERAASPGTVLTGWVLTRLFETDALAAIDFGRGDDGYKKAWASQRRVRCGMALANPLTPSGLLQSVRHAAGHLRRKMQKIRQHINAMARSGGG